MIKKFLIIIFTTLALTLNVNAGSDGDLILKKNEKPNNSLLGLFTKFTYNKGLTNHRLPNRHPHHHQNLNIPPR